MSSAIQLQSVSKSFKDFTAVEDLSFDVGLGDIYGFLGPNGSGKSTTLRMIMGLIKPTSGQISLFGKSITTQRHEVMSQVGCIIEKPDFYGYLSALDNLKLCARAHQLSFSSSDFTNLFRKVGLLGRENDKVKNYSHGMKQRLGLAQVLIHDPALIILDEPNTGLDPQGIIDLRMLLMDLNKEHGKTIIFSSHILSEVQQMCSSMLLIHKGKRIAQGKVSELLSMENLHVRLEVVQFEACATLLKNSSWNNQLQEINQQEFSFFMSKQTIPAMVNFLHEHHIDILRLDYKNQLEEYFLKMTQS
ncbi:MAG: ABC transporter ATP-binding protein [Chitinophagaceae bacterium]|nr:ABC transporter ATP-binding protein [Chitinophagaceae bacterium]